MRNVWRFGGAGLLIVAAACLAAPGNPPTVPGAAVPAMKRYQAAVTVADADHTRAVDKARAQLVTDLKAAQKTALQNNDVDGATAIAAMAKTYAGGGAAAANAFAGTSWTPAGGNTYRLNADGTFTCSDPKLTGTWLAAGDRQVVLFQDHGFVDVWRFDKDAKTFKAAFFKSEGGYDGAAAK